MKIKSLLQSFISISVMSLLLVGTFTNQCFSGEVGVTKSTIKMGMTMPMSGFLASGGVRIAAGAQVIVRHINDHGGIHGRQVKLLIEDDQYQPARTVAMAKKLLYRDNIFCFAGSLGASHMLAIAPLLKKEKVPVVTTGSSRKLSNPPNHYIFPFYPPNDLDAYFIIEYIMKAFKAKNPKLAVIYIENDMGVAGLRGVRESVKPYGLKLVAEELYKPGAFDFTSQIVSFRVQKPDFVIIPGTARDVANLLKQAKKMRLVTQIIGTNTSASDKLVELAGDTAKGYISSYAPVLHNSDDPGAVEYRNLTKKYQPKQDPDFGHLLGYNALMIVREGLKRAGKVLPAPHDRDGH